MAASTPFPVAIPNAAFPPRRFTVDQYRRMAEAGVLAEDDRVELLEGWIVDKMTHNPPHDAAVIDDQPLGEISVNDLLP